MALSDLSDSPAGPLPDIEPLADDTGSLTPRAQGWLEAAGGTLEVWRFDAPLPYQPTAAFQQRLVEAVRRDGLGPVVLLLRHPAVTTLGRAADPADAAGAAPPVVRSHRGGSVTVHGPGQAIAYPVLDLRRHGLTVHGHVRMLETWMARGAAQFGVATEVDADRTGLWTEGGKIGSIGIAVRGGVTWHGLALYARDQRAAFGSVRPCALPDVVPDALEHHRPGIDTDRVLDALEETLGGLDWIGAPPRVRRIPDLSAVWTAPGG